MILGGISQFETNKRYDRFDVKLTLIGNAHWCQLKRKTLDKCHLHLSLDPPRIPLKKGDFERILLSPPGCWGVISNPVASELILLTARDKTVVSLQLITVVQGHVQSPLYHKECNRN